MNEGRVVKNLKGGSFSATQVIEFSNFERRVRKSVSSIENREYGLVRWQSQIRRMQHLRSVLPNHTPPILAMGVSGQDFFYEIPYYESSQNLYEYLSERGESEAVSLFDEVKDLINMYSQTKYGEAVGSFSVFFSEEVVGRITNVDDQLEFAYSSGSINKEELLHAQRLINRASPMLSKVMSEAGSLPIAESLTHGNFTLENALYDHNTKSIILIDPYSETYSESILGDFSQLMQSSVSFYEEIVSRGEYGVSYLFEVVKNPKKTGVYYFGECLKRYVAELSPVDQRITNLFHAAQFVRMFPFKIDKTPRLAIYFLLYGLRIIEEEYRLC